MFWKELEFINEKEFFEKPNNNNNNNNKIDTTFDGFEISKDRKNIREFHRYPVIILNLKKDKPEDYESTIKSLKNVISKLFKYHRKDIDFNKLDSNEQRKWSQIEDEVEDVQLLEESIKFLMGYLNEFYKRNCIVLINEYDNYITYYLDKEYFKDLIFF